jgi:Family of unknown function (DUF6885)
VQAARLEITLLPGARELLAMHARELPQRDDLCGAFCGALALQAAGIAVHDGEAIDQDAVALAAGTVVCAHREADVLPFAEPGRRDYRLRLPRVEDPAVSGTTAAGLVQAIERLGEGGLSAIPYTGPWTGETVAGLFELAAGLARPVTLVANLATRELWGSRVRVAQLLDYLLEGASAGPPPDWDVGHFACVVGCVAGPGGCLYALADTYPSLGDGGVHLQPRERLAAALARRGMAPGGMIAVLRADDAQTVRCGAHTLGLVEGLWDNGSVTAEMPA